MSSRNHVCPVCHLALPCSQMLASAPPLWRSNHCTCSHLIAGLVNIHHCHASSCPHFLCHHLRQPIPLFSVHCQNARDWPASTGCSHPQSGSLCEVAPPTAACLCLLLPAYCSSEWHHLPASCFCTGAQFFTSAPGYVPHTHRACPHHTELSWDQTGLNRTEPNWILLIPTATKRWVFVILLHYCRNCKMQGLRQAGKHSLCTQRKWVCGGGQGKWVCRGARALCLVTGKLNNTLTDKHISINLLQDTKGAKEAAQWSKFTEVKVPPSLNVHVSHWAVSLSVPGSPGWLCGVWWIWSSPRTSWSLRASLGTEQLRWLWLSGSDVQTRSGDWKLLSFGWVYDLSFLQDEVLLLHRGLERERANKTKSFSSEVHCSMWPTSHVIAKTDVVQDTGRASCDWPEAGNVFPPELSPLRHHSHEEHGAAGL